MPQLPDSQHALCCFLYNVVLENHSVQNSPWGEGCLLAAQGLINFNVLIKFSD